MKAAERRYGLIDGFARCLLDDRQPAKVRHSLEDLLAQRIFGLACGSPDANDADGLADDPMHKLLLGRDPVAGAPLASQPTISRFENDQGSHALYYMGVTLAELVVERHRQRLHGLMRRITIDLDPSMVVATPFRAPRTGAATAALVLVSSHAFCVPPS